MWETSLLVNRRQCIITHGIGISFFHSTLVVFMHLKYEYGPPDTYPSLFSYFNSDDSFRTKC